MEHEEYEILIIEDNPHDAELMIRALKKNNLANNLIVIEDGVEALDYIFCKGKYRDRSVYHPPKVIFLDLKLPKVNGLQILQKIKKNKNTRRIPVIVVTSSREDPDISTAYDLGANSYVVKPVNYHTFTRIMNQLGLYWLIVNEKSK